MRRCSASKKRILVHGKHSVHNLFSEESHTCAQNLVVSERSSSYSRLESCSLGCNSAGKKICQHARNISEENCYNGWLFPNQEMEGVKIPLPVNPWYIWWGNSLVSINLLYAVLRTMEVLKCKSLELPRLMNDLQVSFINFHLPAYTEKYCCFHCFSEWENHPLAQQQTQVFWRK